MRLTEFPAKGAGILEGGAIFIGPCFRRDTGLNWPDDGTNAVMLLVRTWENEAFCRLVNRRYEWNTQYGVGPEMLLTNFIDHDFYINMYREITATTSTLYVDFYDDYEITTPSAYITPNTASLPLYNGDTPTPDLEDFYYFVAVAGFAGDVNPGYNTSGILDDFYLIY